MQRCVGVCTKIHVGGMSSLLGTAVGTLNIFRVVPQPSRRLRTTRRPKCRQKTTTEECDQKHGGRETAASTHRLRSPAARLLGPRLSLGPTIWFSFILLCASSRRAGRKRKWRRNNVVEGVQLMHTVLATSPKEAWREEAERRREKAPPPPPHFAILLVFPSLSFPTHKPAALLSRSLRERKEQDSREPFSLYCVLRPPADTHHLCPRLPSLLLLLLLLRRLSLSRLLSLLRLLLLRSSLL